MGEGVLLKGNKYKEKPLTVYVIRGSLEVSFGVDSSTLLNAFEPTAPGPKELWQKAQEPKSPELRNLPIRKQSQW